MSILIDKNTKVICQASPVARDFPLRTSYRLRHQNGWRRNPGQRRHPALGLPVFNTVREAVEATGATASVIYVPAPFCKDSILEAIDAGIKLIITITEGIPTLDMLTVKVKLDEAGVRMIGPNCQA